LTKIQDKCKQEKRRKTSRTIIPFSEKPVESDLLPPTPRISTQRRKREDKIPRQILNKLLQIERDWKRSKRSSTGDCQ
jgi:hypothetical protein